MEHKETQQGRNQKIGHISTTIRQGKITETHHSMPSIYPFPDDDSRSLTTQTIIDVKVLQPGSYITSPII